MVSGLTDTAQINQRTLKEHLDPRSPCGLWFNGYSSTRERRKEKKIFFFFFFFLIPVVSGLTDTAHPENAEKKSVDP